MTTSPNTLADAMTGQDATNGWDVVYAMNLKQVNALLLQQFLQHPASPTVRLWVKLDVQDTSWILDVELGPPKLQFEAGSQTASLVMELVRGSLITFDDDDQVIHSALRIRPLVSRLTGPLVLAKTAGDKDNLGKVRVDLGQHAYDPAIAGVDKGSVLATEISAAVKTFFAHSEFSYLLGWIAPNTGLPACLNPQDFHFTTQKDGNDACVLLLIRTDGKGGDVKELPTYPIPQGHSAAMLVAGKVVGGLLAEALKKVFEPLRSTVNMQSSETTWKVSTSGGDLNLGTIGRKDERILDEPYSCDDSERQNEQEVHISLDGFTFQPENGALVARWAQQKPQKWGYYKDIGDKSMGEHYIKLFKLSSTIKATYGQTAKPAFNPAISEDDVTFEGTGTTNVEVEGDEVWGISYPRPALSAGIQGKLKPVLETIRLPHVNVFALDSLLFPSNHFVHLREAALPGALYLTGSLDQPIELDPPEASAIPGGSVTFKVKGRDAKEFTWRLNPVHAGSISDDGVYTAPKSITDAILVVVSAQDKKDLNRIGNAMILVYQPAASGGVAVAPATVLVTAKHKVEFSTTDPDGKPLSVTWKLSPDLGEMKPKPHAEGRYVYTAPTDCEKVTEITAMATDANNAARHGEARIQLVPRVEVTVTPAKSSVKPVGSVELRAAVPGAGHPQLRWGIDPPGAGSVTPHDDPSQATYHAPQVAPADKNVTVYVYLTEGGAGLAAADVTLIG